jgi:hypothetical protein
VAYRQVRVRKRHNSIPNQLKQKRFKSLQQAQKPKVKKQQQTKPAERPATAQKVVKAKNTKRKVLSVHHTDYNKSYALGNHSESVPRPIVLAALSGQRVLPVRGDFDTVMDIAAGCTYLFCPCPEGYIKDYGPLLFERIDLTDPITYTAEGDNFPDSTLLFDGYGYGAQLAVVNARCFFADGLATDHGMGTINCKGYANPIQAVCPYEGGGEDELDPTNYATMPICAQLAHWDVEFTLIAPWDATGIISGIGARTYPTVYGDEGDPLIHRNSGNQNQSSMDRTVKLYDPRAICSLYATQLADRMVSSCVVGASEHAECTVKMLISPDGTWAPLQGNYSAGAIGNAAIGGMPAFNMRAAVARGKGFVLVRNPSTRVMQLLIKGSASWNVEVTTKPTVAIKSNTALANPAALAAVAAHVPDPHAYNAKDLPGQIGIGRDRKEAHDQWLAASMAEVKRSGNQDLMDFFPVEPTQRHVSTGTLQKSAGQARADEVVPAKPSILDQLFGHGVQAVDKIIDKGGDAIGSRISAWINAL